MIIFMMNNFKYHTSWENSEDKSEHIIKYVSYFTNIWCTHVHTTR